MRGILIYNPTSGRQLAKRLLPQIEDVLKNGGFVLEPRPTGAPGDATRLAREAAEAGAEVVFAMGGDGTLREAAAGILGGETALAPLPAGTTNVLARALGLPCDPLAAARALTTAERREVDVGLVGGEPFLMMCSGGLDAAVMGAQHAGLKKLLGPAAMTFAALSSWWSYGYPEIEVRLEDGHVERATLVVAANIPLYGGSFRMAPDADFADGFLDLVLFRGRGRAATLGLARDLALGRHVRRRDVDVVRIREAEVLGPPEVPFQIDGDVLRSPPPFRLGLTPRRLSVLLP